MDSSHFQPFIDFLRLHPHWVGVSIAVISMAESLALVGIVVPGVVLLFLLSALAGGGVLSLEACIFAAWLGAALGDGLSYYLGRIFHQRVHDIWPFRRYPKVLAQGETFFKRHGGKSVVIGRFVGPVRPVIPMVAGMFDMPSRSFFFINLSSAVAWAPVYTVPGFLVGASVAVHVALPPHFYLILFGALGILLALMFLFFNLHWQAQPDSRLYQWAQRWLAQSGLTQRFWHLLASPRRQPPEFPLPSLLLLVGSLLIFIMLSLMVVETHWFERWNLATLQFFQQLRQPLLDPVFICVTLLGDPRLHYFLFSLLVLFLLLKRHYMAALHVALAGLATSFSIELLKSTLSVPRPQLLSHPPHSAAFPSGHAGGAMVFWGLVATFIAQEMPAAKRWRCYSLCLLPPLLIAISRLYLQVHWLSDVCGGLIWGAAICAATRLSYSPHDRAAISYGWQGLALTLAALLGAMGYLYLTYGHALQMYALAG